MNCGVAFKSLSRDLSSTNWPIEYHSADLSRCACQVVCTLGGKNAYLFTLYSRIHCVHIGLISSISSGRNRALRMVAVKGNATRRRRANSGASVIDGKELTARVSGSGSHITAVVLGVPNVGLSDFPEKVPRFCIALILQ
jgi:hypothetical protein